MKVKTEQEAMQLAVVEQTGEAIKCREGVYIRFTPEQRGVGPTLSVSALGQRPTDEEMSRWLVVFRPFFPQITGDALFTDGGTRNGYTVRRILLPAERPLPKKKKAVSEEES